MLENHGQARSSHRFEGSNEPPLRSPSFVFFLFALRARALSCHHTTSLQLKHRNFVEWDCQRVHESRALGVATTSTEV